MLSPHHCLCSGNLAPVDLQISNLGQVGSIKQRYQGVTGSVMLPSVPAFTLAKKRPQAHADKLHRTSTQSPDEVSATVLRSVAMTGLQSQVEAMENMYKKMVHQLESLAHEASALVSV